MITSALKRIPCANACIAAALMVLCFALPVAGNNFQTAVRIDDMVGIEKLSTSATDIDARGTNGKTALMIAAKAGHSKLVENLLQQGADVNAENTNAGTPIMFAAIAGDLQTVDLLLNAGADVNARGSNGWGALMVAASKGHHVLVQKLIDAGADINAADIYLWTPLMRAAYEGKVKVVEVLLHQDAIDLSRRDEHGATALHHAVGRDNADIVKLLASAGADPNLQDFLGRTAVEYTSEESQFNMANHLTQP